MRDFPRGYLNRDITGDKNHPRGVQSQRDIIGTPVFARAHSVCVK